MARRRHRGLPYVLRNSHPVRRTVTASFTGAGTLTAVVA